MIRKLYVICLCFSIILAHCSNPVSSVDEHLQKLWEIQLNEVSSSGLTLNGNSLIFKTSPRTTGLLYKVSKDGKNIQTASTGGCSFGIPLVSANIIYTNNCTGSLFALRTEDLSTVWKRDYFVWIPISAADENYLYVTDLNRITAFDKANGNVLWYTEIIGKNAAAPVIEKDKIYFVTDRLFDDGYLYSLNKANGSINYSIIIPHIEKNSQEGGSRSGVEIWSDKLFVSGINRIFYCFKKATGELLWSFKADAPIEVTPRVSDGKVYFGTLNRTCYALDAYTGKVIWSHQGGGSIQYEPSFYANYVMFKSLGALLILDKNSGGEFLKISSATTKFGFLNAYWDYDGKIYATGFNASNQIPVLIAYQFK